MADQLTVTPSTLLSDPETELEDGPLAHIVRTPKGSDATAIVLEARINGTPLTALCGHVWVPSRDPRQVPACQVCVDIYNTYRIFNENLGDSPRE
jgi:hypothetical protein